jgi:hypothetical protein
MWTSPTSTLANAISRRATPHSAMVTPASTKTGLSAWRICRPGGDLQHYRLWRNAATVSADEKLQERAIDWCRVVPTRFPLQITMNKLINAPSTSLTNSTTRRHDRVSSMLLRMIRPYARQRSNRPLRQKMSAHLS